MKTITPVVLLSFAALGCGGELCDLVATDVSLDSLNRVTFTFENQGEGTVPENVGEVEYAINGRIRGAYAFGNPADQTWRSPGGSHARPTGTGDRRSRGPAPRFRIRRPRGADSGIQ